MKCQGCKQKIDLLNGIYCLDCFTEFIDIQSINILPEGTLYIPTIFRERLNELIEIWNRQTQSNPLVYEGRRNPFFLLVD